VTNQYSPDRRKSATAIQRNQALVDVSPRTGRPPKGKAAIMQVYEARYQGVTTFAPGQLTTIANELIEAYAGGDKPTNQPPGPCGIGSISG
jgi:hypothetical protein